MKQIMGMLRDTWWLWLIFFVIVTCGGLIITPLCFILYPVLIFIGMYFAFQRYDANGIEKKG